MYSETSEEGTLWEPFLCPLFGGCPFLGGWSLFSVLSHNWNSGNLQHPNNDYVLHAEGVSCLEIHSYVRGYHAYKNVWEPARRDALLDRRIRVNLSTMFGLVLWRDFAAGRH